MLHHTVVRHDVGNDGGMTLKSCIDFLEYADKYNLGEVGDAVYESLQKALSGNSTSEYTNGPRPHAVTPAYAETVFRIMPPGNRLRTLLIQGVTSAKCALIKSTGWHMTVFELREWEKKIEGYSEEMLRQIGQCCGVVACKDPLTGKSKNLR